MNKEYPSARSEQFFTYYTKDSVKVSVRLFVAYKIKNPLIALANLNAEEIDHHIESVTHVDMAAACQETSLQHMFSTDMTKIPNEDDKSENIFRVPFVRLWQDKVKTKLYEDLVKYGIELIRLNIEELKISDKAIEKKIGEQA
jgi:regulator of protease activity HflC (stomatin/prohibitin superfamily)